MDKNFGDFLRLKRQEKNLTQKQLAKILYVSESAVSKWEKDIAHPDITLLPKLAQTLGVTEHELITASVDLQSREEKKQAKKWRTLTFSWSLFFYISYAIALIPCFICDLSINKGLTWFWIVLSALILAFTFTNLPILIKKHKLLILPAAMYSALVLLLGVCAVYTNGNWFIIPVVAVLFALIVVFVPIYISKYNVFKKIKKYNDFISVAVDFIFLNILLIIVDSFCVANGHAANHWFLTLAFPITLICYLLLNIIMCVRFLKINKLMKTSFILYFINLLFLTLPFIKVKNPNIQKELGNLNIFNANFSKWAPEITLEQNISLIIFLTILGIATILLTFGLIKHLKTKISKEKI